MSHFYEAGRLEHLVPRPRPQRALRKVSMASMLEAGRGRLDDCQDVDGEPSLSRKYRRIYHHR